jgi:GT2 family glycosyltransferase
MGVRTTIVIPIYNNWALCDNLLERLFKFESDNISEVLVVNDASTDPEISDELAKWGRLHTIREIKNEQNLGFTLSANLGLKAARRQIAEQRSVFLISSDVTINGRFINLANDILFGARRSFVGHKLLFGNTGWNSFDGKIFEYLEGYFLACTSDGWEEIGYFDPNYAPHDFEDVDISTTAKKRGFRLVPLNSPVIVHQGGGTIGYSAERELITNRNREYFRKKWLP